MICVMFAGYKNKHGYGMQSIKGVKYLAHRLAYCEANKVSLESITGLVVRHTCDNPSCTNPNHLLIGTQADNMADKVERNRQRGQLGGELNTTSKLTALQVEVIRSRYKPYSKTDGLKNLASEYGVSVMQIHRIITNKNW